MNSHGDFVFIPRRALQTWIFVNGASKACSVCLINSAVNQTPILNFELKAHGLYKPNRAGGGVEGMDFSENRALLDQWDTILPATGEGPWYGMPLLSFKLACLGEASFALQVLQKRLGSLWSSKSVLYGSYCKSACRSASRAFRTSTVVCLYLAQFEVTLRLLRPVSKDYRHALQQRHQTRIT